VGELRLVVVDVEADLEASKEARTSLLETTAALVHAGSGSTPGRANHMK
jgi:hypothetical protein